MVLEKKYARNIQKIAELVILEMNRQREKIPADNFRQELLDSFFAKDQARVYMKRYSPLAANELSAVVVNFAAAVKLDDITSQKQKATATYAIDFVTAANDNSNEARAIDRILYAAAIIDEALRKTNLRFFEAEEKTLRKLEITAKKANDGINDLFTAQLLFEVVTQEIFSDIDDNSGEAEINETEITVNNGTYNIIKEW